MLLPSQSNKKELKKQAQKLLSKKDLFPRSKVDYRETLSPYQVKKIRAALRGMENHFGGYVRDITPIGRGRKKYMAEHGLPAYFIGVDLPGGTKVNSNVEYINGEFRYERAGQLRSRMELETRYTEVELIASAKKLLKMRKGRKAALTARGRVMGQIPATKNENVLIKEAVYTYNKYEGMFARGEQRERRNANGTVYYQDAAHPSEWGMGILFEGKIVTKGKAKNGKK